MKKTSIVICFICSAGIFAFLQCGEKRTEIKTDESESSTANFGGYESQEKWGEHLVTIAGCNDCHTPKKMTAHGPDLDSSLLLAGYVPKFPPPDVNRKEMESKGLAVTGDLTAWVGPWGISYTANLTSDTTGIGKWKEEQFIYAIREGKYKGLPDSRPLLPPMPWPMYKHMTDGELKAIFAYLKSTKPIRNVVPPAQPPVLARR